jgi:catechol 2,3-dioxygenase-like lactoylglutathione lyase family enzyme
MPTRRVVIDHLTVGVTDLARSRAFYLRALAPLGFVEQGPWADDHDEVAFAAESRAEVDAFHAEALAAGARDNGAPGPRPEHSPGYYGAFVLDPDGHNVEAVHHPAGLAAGEAGQAP